jgi:hypothetical protein
LKQRNRWDNSTLYIILSFSGLFLLLFFIFTAPAAPFYGKGVLVLFILTCILGGLAARYPRQCAGIFQVKKDTSPVENNRGHHPDCEPFQDHVLTIRGESYCAGCTGLLVGAVVAILGALIYYFYPFSFNGEIAVFTGAGAVFVSLFILFGNKAQAWGKFTANFTLVVGSLLILLGMYNLKSSLIIQLYFLGLILVWIVSRSEVSRNNHDRTCGECEYQADCEL